MDEQLDDELARLMEQLRPFLQWVIVQPQEAIVQVVEHVQTVCAVFENRAIVRGSHLLCPDWWAMEQAALWLANYARLEYPTAATLFDKAVSDARTLQQAVGTRYTDDCQHLWIEVL